MHVNYKHINLHKYDSYYILSLFSDLVSFQFMHDTD